MKGSGSQRLTDVARRISCQLTDMVDVSDCIVLLAVKDTGIGINGDAQMRLFERFNQATPRTEGIYGGSGLGLNISRRLCHLYGGKIGVSSKEGGISTFGLFFRVRKYAHTGGEGVGVDDISEVDKVSQGLQALGRQSFEVEGSTQDVRIPKDLR